MLPDIQNSGDTRGVALKWVGIEDYDVFIRLKEQDNGIVPVQAKVSLAVQVPAETRGTHMSRFLTILNENSERFLHGDGTQDYFGGKHILEFLEDITKVFDSESAWMKMDFKYFVTKKAPVTGSVGKIAYDCTFEGEIIKGIPSFRITATVPVTTACPCSKEISERGAHNQRCMVTISVKSPADRFFWLEDLFTIANHSGSCEIYSSLKREDEKFVTEAAYDNPRFVEDVVREAALLLQAQGIAEYSVKAVAQESIHNHQAFAYTDHTEVMRKVG